MHWLAPTLITLLKQRRDEQDAERKTAGETWKTQRCDGRKVELVFTTTTGGLVLRQTVDTAIKRLGKKAGMDPEVMAKVATHTGRRTVVTAMYEGDMPIDDIAHHVGHALPYDDSRLCEAPWERPQQVAERAARLLDPSVKAAEKDESRDD